MCDDRYRVANRTLTGSKITMVLCSSGSGFKPSTREVYSSDVSRKCGNVNTTGASANQEDHDREKTNKNVFELL